MHTRFPLGFAVFLGCFLNAIQALSFSKTEDALNDSSPQQVLVFLSKDCPCSRSHIQHLNQLARDYKKKVSFFGVITDLFDGDQDAEIESYYGDKGFEFPLIRDDQQTLIKKYKALKTPHVVLLSKTSPESILFEGGVTDKRDFAKSKTFYLKSNLEALAQGHPLPYREEKSLGCYIRRI